MASRHKLVFVRRARAMFEFITDYLWQNKDTSQYYRFSLYFTVDCRAQSTSPT
jgi:hypothetical protein